MDQILITNIFLVIVGSFIILLTLALLFISYQIYKLVKTVRGIINNATAEVARAQNIISFFGKKIFPDMDKHISHTKESKKHHSSE